jgi:tripartite ATP-independent transporter DctP family solute receptor
MKKILMPFFIMVILFSLITTVSAQKNINFTVASVYQEGNIMIECAKKFTEIVNKSSDGKINGTVRAGGVYGTEEEIVELCSQGGVEAQAAGGIVIQSFANDYYVEIPYLFKDFTHLIKVFHPKAPKIGKPMNEMLLKKGNQIILAPVYNGIRQFTSNKPVRTPKDVKGMKLRLPSVQNYVTIWKQVGTVPVTIPLTELYTALSTGAADASEGPASQIWTQSLYEVQKYISFTNHFPQVGWLVMNAKFFKSLSVKDQKLLKSAALKAAIWATTKAVTDEKALFKQMKKKGVTLISNVNFDAFAKLAKPAIKKILAGKPSVKERDISKLKNWSIPDDWAKIATAYQNAQKEIK